jgi:hypothetical protein
MIAGWVILLLMRVQRFERVADALGGDDFGQVGPWLAARVLTAAFVGLIGGGGIAVALAWIGIRRDGSDWLRLILGWTLSYALVHAIVYVVTRAWSLEDAFLLDLRLSWEPEVSGAELVSAARLMDVVPAALGGAIVAAVLSRADRGLTVRLVPAWAAASILAVLVVATISSSHGGGPFGDLMLGPRRYALVVGLVAGALQGLVGGGLTLRSIMHQR